MDLRIIICRMQGVIPLLFAIFFLAVGVSSCRTDEDMHPVPDRTATIFLNFKGDQRNADGTRAPMTRANPLEDDIKTVDVLSFKVDPSDPTNMKKGTFFYRVRGTYDPAKKAVQVRLVGNSHGQTLVILANSRKQVDVLGASYGEAKTQVMSRLKLRAGTDGKVVLTIADGTPMWGELPNQTVNDSYAQTLATAPTVNLMRMIAKITIDAGVEHITACHLYHSYTAGQIAPNNVSGNATVDPADAAPAAPAYVDYSSNFPMMGGTSFYIFESDNRQKAAADKMKNTFLTIKATNTQANSYWYRIDLKDYTAGEYYDILRNNEYKIELTTGGVINSPGADTEEEAIKGVNKFKCKIVPWTVVEENVIVDANKRLTVDKRYIYVPSAQATTGRTLTITTEQIGGWTISNDHPAWMHFSQKSHNADGTKTITITTHDGYNEVLRTGKFTLTAGTMKMDIRVQAGKCPLECVAEYNLAGGARYIGNLGSIPTTPAQTDTQLRWATNHNNDQSGYYNWYVCKGPLFNDPFFTTGAGKGYHLPSVQELTGVFSYNMKVIYGSVASTPPNVHEAIEFGGVKRTFANEYKTSGNGVCYALRFKAGTPDTPPTDGSSLTTFPTATHNGFACAYRYTKVGSFVGGNLGSHLKVECIYVGDLSPLPSLSVIANDAWWASRTAQTITRIFPAAGGVFDTGGIPPYNMQLDDRGTYGYYWSNAAFYSTHAWAGHFNSGNANMSQSVVHSKISVRLFADE